MKFLIISSVLHRSSDGKIGGYGPYVREMNLWLKHVEKVRLIAPVETGEFDPIDLAYTHPNIEVIPVPAFSLISAWNVSRTLFCLPIILLRIFQGMRWAEHIHLRCPSNMGLLGCFVQTLFPGTRKTAKYAANWDLDDSKVWSYRLQQHILRNTFLSRRMQVMVYGNWPGATRNVVNSFTASYHRNEIEPLVERSKRGTFSLVFVARLIKEKNPSMAVEVVKQLLNEGHDVQLDIFGDGPQREIVEQQIVDDGLSSHVHVHGNVNKERLKQTLKKAHLLLFPTSMSEGWPKVVAEAMFWGCVPVTTRISCVPFMLDEGARGTLIQPDVNSTGNAVRRYLSDRQLLSQHAHAAAEWSRQFTLERFETEIVKLLSLNTSPTVTSRSGT